MHSKIVISEILEYNNNYGNEIIICGWIDEINENTIKLKDFSGEIICIFIDKCTTLNYRDVIGIRGFYDVDKKIIKVLNFEIMGRNSWLTKEDLADGLESYLTNSYLYNLKEERIRLLKELNMLEKSARRFLTDNYKFVELKSPVFWTQVQEYGENEWVSMVYGKESEEGYVLPQSPEIISLLNSIGGVQRNFIFGKCFRSEKKQNSNDTVVEFTQLVITAAFLDLKMGMEVVTNLLINMINEVDMNKADKVEFNEISYSNSHLFYGTDKPDLRYKEVYTPLLVDSSNGVEYLAAIIPFDIEVKILNTILSIIQNHVIKDDVIAHHYTVATSEQFEIIKGLSYRKIKKTYGLDKDFTMILITNKKSINKKILKKCISLIYELKKIDVPKYCFTWIVDFPFNAKPGLKDAEHNIFSIVDEWALDNIDLSKEYYIQNIDLVLNGTELGSGGLRQNKRELFTKLLNFHNVNKPEEIYEYYMNALDSGAPKSFTISLGWERILFLLTGCKCIQEVINFPKDETGKCLVTNTPRVFK